MAQKVSEAYAYIRFFHAIASPTAIYDIYVDDQLFNAGILFEDFTKYVAIPAAFHYICIKEHQHDEILFEKKVTIPKGQIFTYILAATPNPNRPFHLYSVQDTVRPYAKDLCFARFIHFSSCLPTITITGLEEKTLQNNLGYGMVGNYTPYKVGIQPLDILLKSTKESIFATTTPKLKPYRFYTFYLLDDVKKENTPRLLTSIDGNSFLTFATEG